MSKFTYRASDAEENANDYVAALLDVLGNRDPLVVQSEHPAALREAVEGLNGSQLRTPEAPGKWAILDVLGHLADTELVYRYRMRQIVAEPGSDLPGYDQDAWADGLRYTDAEVETVLREFETLRSANLRWIRQLSDEEMDREGVHGDRGPESVRHIVRLIAAHDLVHRRQIQRIRASVV